MKIREITPVSYDNGSLAVMADTDDGAAVLSVNLAAYGLVPASPDQFYVKDYSESVGLAKLIEEQGFATKVGEVFVGQYNSRCILMQLNPA
jgi:hypothetical protein